MPSPGRMAARPCWRRWTGGTCSWSRWMTAAGGIATTISLLTCCMRGCSTSSLARCRTAEDFERAAGLVELAIPAMRRTRQEATVRRWLEALPDDLVRVRPVLSVHFAGALLTTGELEGVEERLRDAERWLDAPTALREGPQAPLAEMVAANEEEYRRLPAAIEVYRAALALARGGVPGTVRHARRALDLSPEEDHLARA